MNSPPIRRPPLKTDDVRRLLTSLDKATGSHPSAFDGFTEVAAAVGFVSQWPTDQAVREFTATDEEWEEAAKNRPPMPEAVKQALAKADARDNVTLEPAPMYDPEKGKNCAHEVWLIRKGTTEFYCPDCGAMSKEPPIDH